MNTKFAFYTIGDQSLPSTRFRICQYFPEFKRAGISVELFSLLPTRNGRIRQVLGLLRQGIVRTRQLRKLSHYDLVIVQKGLTPWRCRGLAERLWTSRVPYLLDLDDAVYTLTPVRLPGPARWLQDEEEPMKLIQKARAIIVGNPNLAEYIQRYRKGVTVIPTPIDTEKYRVPIKSPQREPVIGWSGSQGTNLCFNLVIPALNLLAKEFKFSLLIISNHLRQIQTEKLQGFSWNFTPWREETEVEDLQKIDIGLMPLEDNELTRGKCGLKALQYMALGTPAVCSPVGVNTEIIQEGVNGFLASCPETWVQKLSLLLQDPTLREEMGLRARNTVEEKYSVKVHFPRLVRVMEQALEEKE